MIKFIGNFTDAMKAYAEEKFEKLKKYTDSQDITLRVKVIGLDTSVEISVDNKIRATSSGDDYYELLVPTIEKIILQIEKYKKYKASLGPELESEEFDYAEPEIAREKVLILDDMTAEEAIETMNLLGHDFFMYKDIDRQAVCTVYRRYDGRYGVLIGK